MTRSPLFWSAVDDGDEVDVGIYDTPAEARTATLLHLRSYAAASLEGMTLAWGTMVETERVVPVPRTTVDDDPTLGGRLRSVTAEYELRPVVVEPSPRDLLLSAYRRYVRGIVAMSARVGGADALRRELERTADEIERLERILGVDEHGEGGLEPAEELGEGPVVAGPAVAEGSGRPRGTATATSPARTWMTLVRKECAVDGCASEVEVWLSQLPPAHGDRWRCLAAGHHGTVDAQPPGSRMYEIFFDAAPGEGLTRAAVELLVAEDHRDPVGAAALNPDLHPSSEAYDPGRMLTDRIPDDGHDLVDSYRRPALEVIRGGR